MTILDNAHHEIYAQEIAAGKPQREAYRAAGYSESDDAVTDACASRLRTHESVDRRIKEIQTKAAKRVELTRADILQFLLDDRKLAHERGQAAASIRAAELLGKEVAGMFVEKKEIKTGFLDEVDVGELERLRETLVGERDRRAAETNGTVGEPSQDRKVLSGPWPPSTGTISKAS